MKIMSYNIIVIKKIKSVNVLLPFSLKRVQKSLLQLPISEKILSSEPLLCHVVSNDIHWYWEDDGGVLFGRDGVEGL